MNYFKPCWRLGATSFVLPADVSDNVLYLADKVDDIQLLFFESPSRSKLPHRLDIELLKKIAGEHGLSYTVHLPLGLALTSPVPSERSEAVGDVCRIVEEVSELAPLCYDLHLDYPEDREKESWLAAIDSSSSLLSRELGSLVSRVAVENINYPFREVRPLVLNHGLAFCLDFGHALYYGDDISGLINDIPRAAHIHYHGVKDKDHRALTGKERDLTVRIGKGMRACGFEGVFTLEVYDSGDLEKSLLELSEAWGMEMISDKW